MRLLFVRGVDDYSLGIFLTIGGRNWINLFQILGRHDRLADDIAKLVAFIEQISDSLLAQEIGFDNEADPASGFSQLLEHDFELVNEIGPAFRSSC